MSLFPNEIDKVASIRLNKIEKNELAYKLHKVIRKGLKLSKDFDPNTGE